MNLSQVPGVLGTGLVIAGYVPQIYLIKERCTAGLSLSMTGTSAPFTSERVRPAHERSSEGRLGL